MTVLSEAGNFRFPMDLNWFSIIIIVLGMLLLIAGIVGMRSSSDDPSACVFCMLAIVFGIGLIASGLANRDAPTEYKVILTDDYSAKELLSKYEVMDIDGEIYILRDREEKEDGDRDKDEAQGKETEED